MMYLLELFKTATQNLVRHKLRTGLTMLGMIFGVAAVLAMLSIGAGAEQQTLTLIQKMGIRNITVRSKTFDAAELTVLRQDSPGLTRKDLEGLAQALPKDSILVGKKQLKTYQISSAFGKADSRVIGVGGLFPFTVNLNLVAGSFFLPIDGTLSSQVCVLGVNARQKLFGLNDPIGDQIKINSEWFTVLGVLSDDLVEKDEFEGIKVENLNNDIFIPLETLLNRFERDPVDNELDEIVVRVPESADIGEMSSLISGMVGGMHRRVDDFSLVVPEELLQQKRQTQRIFNIVMGAIASISLLVGGIGIMNIMLASVLERTSEIGLRRALGARRRDIGRQFIFEAVAISVTGALLGIGLGYFISNAVSTYSGWPTIVRPLSVLLGVGVSVSIGLAFGIYPARRATLVSPIEALRYE